MATSSIVNTLGAGSGIDIKALADNLVEAERAPRKQRIDDKITQTEAKISGYSAVKFALSELKSAFEKLNDASDFASLKVNNSQPAAFGATASTSAAAGSYSLAVTQVAQPQRNASSLIPQSRVFSQAFDLELVYDGNTTEIKVPENATAGTIVSAINSKKLGVTAQLINTGQGQKIVLTGETGAAKEFSLQLTSNAAPVVGPGPEVVAPLATAVTLSYPDPADANKTLTVAMQLDASGKKWVPPSNANLPGNANFTATAVQLSFSETIQTTQDAKFTVNGVEIVRPANSISDAIEGVTLDLYTVTTGAARLDLNRETTGIKDQIKALVTAYKDFDETLKVLGDRESEVETFGGALAGDSLLQNVRNQVRSLITNPSDTPGTTIVAARNVGLSFDRNGMLQLDEAKLDAALQNNFDEVVQMFSAGTNNQSVYSAAPAGLAGKAVKSLDEMLRSTGLIDKQSATAQKKIAEYQTELEKLQDRMDMLLNRYMKQFSAMESIVGNSNSLRTSLKGTFEGMMNAYKN